MGDCAVRLHDGKPMVTRADDRILMSLQLLDQEGAAVPAMHAQELSRAAQPTVRAQPGLTASDVCSVHALPSHHRSRPDSGYQPAGAATLT